MQTWRKKSQLQNSNSQEMSQEGGTKGAQEGTRTVKHGQGGGFSPTRHLSNDMKSLVKTAFGSISQVPGPPGQGLVELARGQMPNGHQAGRETTGSLRERCPYGIIHTGLGLTQILISQTTAVRQVAPVI